MSIEIDHTKESMSSPLANDKKKGKIPKNRKPRDQWLTPENLHLRWAETHRRFLYQQLAEMYGAADAARTTLREFAVEWDILDRTEEEKVRAKAVLRWVYIKADSVLHHPGYTGARKRIAIMRDEWRRGTLEAIPAADKRRRIRDLAMVFDLAVQEHRYSSAVMAYRAIREELEGNSINISGVVNHKHELVTPESEIDAEIRKVCADLGIGAGQANSFIRQLNQGESSAAPTEEATAEGVETPPAEVYQREARDTAGDDPVEPVP